MGQKLFNTAVYANKATLVAADLVPIGDSAATTGGVANNKTSLLSGLAAFVAANATTLAGVNAAITATAPASGDVSGTDVVLTPSLKSGGGSRDGRVIVRQPGGVAGTDEGQLYNDGTEFTIARAGNGSRIKLKARDNSFVITDANGGCAYVAESGAGGIIGAGIFKADSNGSIGFQDGTNPLASSVDAGFNRVTANVVGLLSGDWLQNTAGESRVNAPVTVSGTTLSAITGLSSTVIAGRKYGFEIVLNASNDVAADGFRIDFDGGNATMTSFFATGFYYAAAGAAYFDPTTALATNLVSTNFSTGTIILKGGFVVNAGGTFIPRIAEEDAAGGGTGITVAINSTMRLWDIP